jgi:hypothetical protein
MTFDGNASSSNMIDETLNESRILERHDDFYQRFQISLESFLTEDLKKFDQHKSTLLLDFLQVMKKFKYRILQDGFGSENDLRVVREAMEAKLFDFDEKSINIFKRCKSLIIIRQSDRTLRENAVKLLKKLINFSPDNTCRELLALKLEVFVSFILEREYKHVQV